MARTLGLRLPAGGLAVGVLALALWFSALPLRWLDALVALLFLAGVGLALAAVVRGADARTRHVGVLALGWNAFGLIAIAVVYLAG
jgi:hypothetical protein